MNIKLLGNRVLIKADLGETKTNSGLIIQKSADNSSFLYGEVVAVGPGKRVLEDGGFIYIDVSVGDRVMYQYGNSVQVDGAEYVLVGADDIVAVI